MFSIQMCDNVYGPQEIMGQQKHDSLTFLLYVGRGSRVGEWVNTLQLAGFAGSLLIISDNVLFCCSVAGKGGIAAVLVQDDDGDASKVEVFKQGQEACHQLGRPVTPLFAWGRYSPSRLSLGEGLNQFLDKHFPASK